VSFAVFLGDNVDSVEELLAEVGAFVENDTFDRVSKAP
jgi:hypothetical protein